MFNYTVQSPVLFLIFNRPDTTLRVFEQIKAVRPSRLYIAADGPRPDRPPDVALCREARDIVKLIDWDCQVNTLFSETNKGCKMAVSTAISWFFEQEEEGIILEDDCVPVRSFFYFCDTLLQKYRHDTRVRNITGTNLQRGQQWGDATYYFSQYSNIWGWASWRRVWQQYDLELKRYTEQEAAVQLRKVFHDPFLVAGWEQIFRDLKAGRIDTWDYQLNFITFFENGLCATPNVNLISNIGFGENATHTLDLNSHNAMLPVAEITEIVHPRYFLPEKEADYYFLRKEFDLDAKWRRHNKWKRRLKRWIKSRFTS